MAVSSATPNTWFRVEQVREVSDALGDPEPVRRRREEAFAAYQKLPAELNPLYRKYAYFAGVDLGGLDPALTGSPVRMPPVHPGEILLVHDASGTRVYLPDELRKGGITVRTLPELLRGGDADSRDFFDAPYLRSEKFQSLNAALVNRAVYLRVPDRFPTPVRVQDISILSKPAEGLVVRRFLRPGQNTKLLYSEEVYSTGPSPRQRLYSSSVDILPADDTDTVYLTVHAPDGAAVSFFNRRTTTARNAKVGWIWAGFDGFRTISRNESVIGAPGGEVEDLQTIYGDQDQAFNSYVEITHAGDDTKGQSITRGVFKDRARGTSRGMMRIQPQTRKVVSYLSEHAMLLSKGARSESVPGLEILSSQDVKATHSSSVAPIDPERVFYLESRGIPAPEATRMITEGFLAHVLDRAPVEGLREVLYPPLDLRWNGSSVTWSAEGALPSLPPLRIAGWGTMGDWRMDTKLRDAAGRSQPSP